MGRRQTKLTPNFLMGAIKDKASQSKAALFNPSQPLHLALLRATTHDPFSPPPAKHLDTLLSFGHSSRATASAAIEAIMDRLQTTQSSSVALKCLIAVHHIVKYGSFILQDQLAVFPSAGGRNYLKLSDFRDHSSTVAWDLSTWVRWYGQYVETLIITSRFLGFFVGSNSCINDRHRQEERQEERISAILNSDLVRETERLVSLMEEISQRPESLGAGNKIVGELLALVGRDQIATMHEVSVRVNEFKERLSCMSFVDSVELRRCLKRGEEVEGRLVSVPTSAVKGEVVERFWEMMREMKERVGREGGGERGKMKKEMGAMAVRRESVAESARFGGVVDRVLMTSADEARFSSLRFNLGMEFS